LGSTATHRLVYIGGAAVDLDDGGDDMASEGFKTIS
jgi:hypothetical protein